VPYPEGSVHQVVRSIVWPWSMHMRHNEFEHMTEYNSACETSVRSAIKGVLEKCCFLFFVRTKRFLRSGQFRSTL
jgi:hypothetical protein